MIKVKETDECSIFNYADDNTLSFHHSNVNIVKGVLEDATANAIHWFDINHMQANASKFQAMLLSRSVCNINFIVNGVEIVTTNHVKLLGVEVDKSLNFGVHVSNLCKKAGKRLNCMGRLSKYLSEECLLKICDAFIRSSFSYCTSIWHFCGKALSKKCEKMQERALRLTYKDYSSNYSELLTKAGKCTMYDHRIRNIAVLVFKYLQGEMKPVPENFYVYKENMYSLRNVKTLERPSVKTVTYGINSLRYEGVIIWERLPNEFKLAESIDVFKQCIKRHQFNCECTTCTRCVCYLSY